MQSPQPPSSPRKRHGLGSFITTIVLVGLSIFIWFNQRAVVDTFHFWTYQPSASVSSISDRAGLSDAGTFMLYAAQPSIENNQTFNGKCGRQEQNTAILGCYTQEKACIINDKICHSVDKIYIYDVTDSRLDGIKEVTASHEMLHAVYQRLSPSEKTKVDTLVEVEYAKLSKDPAFAERMAYYARNEPGERDNELHSIIGTEATNISPELEAHYAKYFSNRSKVLALFSSYNSAFATLDNQTKSLQAQLDSLNTKIEASSDKYNADVKQLNADIATFNQRADQPGGFATQSAFNVQRMVLQNQVAAVTAERDAIDADINTYETLRVRYNDTVTKTHDLYKSIDSNLSPAPNQV